jgi:serine protease DegQ
MRHGRRHTPALRRVTGFLAALALVLAACTDDDATAPNGEQAVTTTVPAASGGAVQGIRDLPRLVEEVSASVVSIRVGTGTGAGQGSGVIWDGSGTIVTNHHVVEGSTTVTVVFATGQEIAGRVVATDPFTDLAIVEVDRTDLPAIRPADAAPPIGSPVLAVGTPLGFENSVTFGVVSGAGRAIPGAGPALVDLLQTDAAISPGNSGGALVDLDGRLVGITVAYIPPQARAVAIGFAVPIPTVRFVVASLRENGRVDHAYLGVNLATLNREMAERFGLEVRNGAVVTSVADGSPAARAGLSGGDVIVRVGERAVTGAEDVLTALRAARPGQTLAFEVVRGGEAVEVPVELGTRPAG